MSPENHMIMKTGISYSNAMFGIDFDPETVIIEDKDRVAG